MKEMSIDEAIRRIDEHNCIHQMKESRAIHISEAFDVAKDTMRKYQKIEQILKDYSEAIIGTIQEDNKKVYMVNVETFYIGCGIYRCLGGIFDSLEKAEKYIADLKEKIKEIDLDLGEDLEYYIDEVNLNHGHSLEIIDLHNENTRIDFEDDKILLGGYIEY